MNRVDEIFDVLADIGEVEATVAIGSADVREGVQLFIERRLPHFEGR